MADKHQKDFVVVDEQPETLISAKEARPCLWDTFRRLNHYGCLEMSGSIAFKIPAY